MISRKSITIIGGGLAGLTLGIGLRQREIPVTIHETGIYPRHRICGEFISGRGRESLARLGLQDLLERAGAIPAQTAAFFTATRATPPCDLPASALCLSRFDLDAALARHFCELGGTLATGQRRWEGDFHEGIVRATGRRAHTEAKQARWFGLKIHARNVSLTADLEMHFSPAGYVGLCQIAGGRVNICGLFRRPANGNPGPTSQFANPREWLRGQPGSILNQRLAGAEFEEESFCAIAGLSLRPERAGARPEICLGDAITMIPPVTGNGMSMAFESAEAALAPLTAWSGGKISWAAAKDKIAQACDVRFARRLAWAKWLQRLMLMPVLQGPLVEFTARNPWFWRLAFERTR